eukprot:m.7404 g.7404  ORF g.7404 m.7404 type:complete len:151 (-) comp3708_c0_seq1:29-481(-)
MQAFWEKFKAFNEKRAFLKSLDAEGLELIESLAEARNEELYILARKLEKNLRTTLNALMFIRLQLRDLIRAADANMLESVADQKDENESTLTVKTAMHTVEKLSHALSDDVNSKLLILSDVGYSTSEEVLIVYSAWWKASPDMVNGDSLP